MLLIPLMKISVWMLFLTEWHYGIAQINSSYVYLTFFFCCCCTQDGRVEGSEPHLLQQEFQNYNSVLDNHQQENVGSYQKETSLTRAKGKPQKDGRRGDRCLDSNPIPTRDVWGAQTKPCLHQNQETPQRLRQTLLWVSSAEVWVSSGLRQGQGLWVQQTCFTQPVA